MFITPITFRQFNIPQTQKTVQNEPCELVADFCRNFKLPDEKVNHSQFSESLASKIASYKEKAVKPVTDMLQTAERESDITAGLFLLNRIIDAGAKGVGDSYHIISRFNYSESPNIQVMLSGIYRKTQVPDAFGPLMTMFLRNSNQPKTVPFDPNEEVGGAILEYLRNKSSVNNYSNNLIN